MDTSFLEQFPSKLKKASMEKDKERIGKKAWKSKRRRRMETALFEIYMREREREREGVSDLDNFFEDLFGI